MRAGIIAALICGAAFTAAVQADDMPELADTCPEAASIRIAVAPLSGRNVSEWISPTLEALERLLSQMESTGAICAFPTDIVTGPDHPELPSQYRNNPVANAQFYRHHGDLDLLLWGQVGALRVTSADPFAAELRTSLLTTIGLETEHFPKIQALRILAEVAMEARGELSAVDRHFLATETRSLIHDTRAGPNGLFLLVYLLAAFEGGQEYRIANGLFITVPNSVALLAATEDWPDHAPDRSRGILLSSAARGMTFFGDVTDHARAYEALRLHAEALEVWRQQWSSIDIVGINMVSDYAQTAMDLGLSVDDADLMGTAEEVYSLILERDWDEVMETLSPTAFGRRGTQFEPLQYRQLAARAAIEAGRSSGEEAWFARAEHHLSELGAAIEAEANLPREFNSLVADLPHERSDIHLFRGMARRDSDEMLAAVPGYENSAEQHLMLGDLSSASHAQADIGLVYIEIAKIDLSANDLNRADTYLLTALETAESSRDAAAVAYVRDLQERAMQARQALGP